MKSLFMLLVAAVLVLSFSVAGYAGTQNVAVGGSGTTAIEKKIEPMEKAMTFTGKVTAVNTSDRTIVVKGKEGERTFDVSKAAMKGLVKPKHTVHVTYIEKEGKMIASSVTGMSIAMKHETHKAKRAGV